MVTIPLLFFTPLATTVAIPQDFPTTVIYGGALDNNSKTNLNKLFNVDGENVKVDFTNSNDLYTYLNLQGIPTESLFSSVKVEKNTHGISVNILTPENITTITENQYTNAAITAGISNANIEVASLTKVTGESALAGVYKAVEVNGITLDKERTTVAQVELETVKTISEAINTPENKEKLDIALAEIKTQLAEIKEQTGNLASREQVENIIYEVLKSQGIDLIISREHITLLIDFAIHYQNTSAIDSKEIINQLDNLTKSIQDKINNISISEEEKTSFIEAIKQFFVNIWNAIVDFLSGHKISGKTTK